MTNAEKLQELNTEKKKLVNVLDNGDHVSAFEAERQLQVVNKMIAKAKAAVVFDEMMTTRDINAFRRLEKKHDELIGLTK